jgi:hypothetical protein
MARGLFVRRRVLAVTRSALSAVRWCLALECGHEVWVTSPSSPRVGGFKRCPKCGLATAEVSRG